MIKIYIKTLHCYNQHYCGKAQDLHKWKNNNIRNIVGIDVIKDNIENPYNGAYARLITMQNINKNGMMTFKFLVGDVKPKNIQSLDAFDS